MKLAIELKHTRESLNSAKLGEELIVDRVVIRRTLRCSPSDLPRFRLRGRFENPRGTLEADISREMTDERTGVTVVIIDR